MDTTMRFKEGDKVTFSEDGWDTTAGKEYTVSDVTHVGYMIVDDADEHQFFCRYEGEKVLPPVSEGLTLPFPVKCIDGFHHLFTENVLYSVESVTDMSGSRILHLRDNHGVVRSMSDYRFEVL